MRLTVNKTFAGVAFAIRRNSTRPNPSYKAVFYRPVNPSWLWTGLSDDTGTAPTPRMQVLQSLDQNFYGIAVNWHANAVVVRIDDDDSWPSQHGGGFSYDPAAGFRPKPPLPRS